MSKKITVRDAMCIEDAVMTFFDMVKDRYGDVEHYRFMQRKIEHRLFVISSPYEMLEVPDDRIYYNWEGERTYSFYY